MVHDDCLAIDWGTTNRRLYRLDAEGKLREARRDDRGIRAFAPGDYAAEIDRLRAEAGAIPILAAGMIGSARGWRAMPYSAAPAGVEDIARDCRTVGESGVVLIPGVAFDTPDEADVMRGEETQILGAVAAGHAPGTALFCQPGTHNKWVHTENGRIVRFSTAMTGEMFALLRRDSTLSEMLAGEVEDGPAFRQGLAAARDGALLRHLFGLRASVLLGHRHASDGASYASGLLIGADVAAQPISGRTVHILSEGRLGPLYAAAIAAAGGTPVLLDSEAAFLAGIQALRRALPAGGAPRLP